MPFYGPSTATATITANTSVATIAGMDLTGIVQQGMTISFGARDRQTGDAYLINAVTPNGSTGGTLTLAGTVPTGFTNAPFLIDTSGYLGTDASYAASVSLKLLMALNTLLGAATNVFAGSRQLALDKVSSTAIGRVLFQIAGRSWGAIEHRTHTFTPTGGQAQSIETLAARAFPDGSTPKDALLLDLTTGTGDLRRGAVSMAAASMVDLGSAPKSTVILSGVATINSFGPGQNLERIVYFVGGGATLAHNNTSLDLPGRASIVTQAGDRLLATSDATGNWRVEVYQRADGTPLINVSRGAQSIDGAAGTDRLLWFLSNGVRRWAWYAAGNAEGGTSAGSDLGLIRYDNAGNVIDVPISVSRATGRVTFNQMHLSSVQPAFYALAAADTNVTNGSTRITFGAVTYSRGAAFNGTRFTAPVGGVYQFSAVAQVSGGTPSQGNVGLSLRVNGVLYFSKYRSKAAQFNAEELTAIVPLAANDYVEVFLELDSLGGAPVLQASRTFISGALLY